MGLIVDYAELAGETVGSLLQPDHKIAKAVQNMVCGVYREFPDRITGANNIPAGYVRGFMGVVCEGQLPDPPPIAAECDRLSMVWGTFTRAFKDPGGECQATGYWRQGVILPEGELASNQPFSADGKWWLPKTDGGRINIAPASESIYNGEFFGGNPFQLPFVQSTPSCLNGTESNGGDSAVYTKTTYNKEIPDNCNQGGIDLPGN